MKKIFIGLILALCVILGAQISHAAPFTFGDTVNYWPGWASPQASDNNTDVIGLPQLTGGSGNISNTGALTSLSINYTTSTWDVRAGDVFIDVGADSTWDYVLTPYYNTGFGLVYSLANVGNTSISNASLYNFTNASDWGGYDFRDGHPYELKAGVGSYIGWFSFTDFANGGAGTLSYSNFHLGYQSINLGTQDFIIGFAPTCANDVLYEKVSQNPVPVPTTLLLFGSGLIGFLGLKRRQRS